MDRAFLSSPSERTEVTFFLKFFAKLLMKSNLLIGAIMNPDDFSVWTLFDHPSDYPDCYVARRFSVRIGGPTEDVVTGDSPGQVLLKIQEIDPNACTFIPRDPRDDPKIMGIWI